MKWPLFLALVLGTTPALAQAEATVARPNAAAQRFTFGAYLQQVGRANLDFAAQRSNVSIADAQIGIARVFPDPSVTAGLLQYDLDRAGNPTATIVQLNVPLQLGGQRGARIAFAEANLSAARADLEEFLRGLRAEAANAYVDSLHARLILDRKRQSLTSVERLVSVNAQRFRAGDIGEIAVVQSRVEASQFRAQVLDTEGVVRTADLAMMRFLGRDAERLMAGALDVQGDLKVTSDKSFDEATLLQSAHAARPDLLAAKRRVLAAERQVDLAHANRTVDVAVGGLWQHNFAVSLPPITSGASNLVGGTLTVPIPFSRLYRGEVDAANASQSQAAYTENAIAIRVEVEVRQALAQYEAAAARAKLYTGGVLADADQVLERTFYNYQRGGATLVEVLVAQRTDDDVHLAYFDALADAAHALVAVQRAVGAWNIDF